MSKAMTFEEAKKILSDLADGKYHCIRYELVNYGNDGTGKVVAECSVYIHGYDWEKGATWREALDKMKRSIKPEEPNKKEQPL